MNRTDPGERRPTQKQLKHPQANSVAAKMVAENKLADKPSKHPSYAVMIWSAITNLKKPEGSSKQAIEKYICSNYNVGSKYHSHFKAALNRGVENKSLIQLKGIGASGTFKTSVGAFKVVQKVGKPGVQKHPSGSSKAEHSTIAVMTVTAIRAIKDRKGSSRQAIEKYIRKNYKVGPNFSLLLKKALKRGVEDKSLLQTKGVGANGSFKIRAGSSNAGPAKKVRFAKKTTTKIIPNDSLGQ